MGLDSVEIVMKVERRFNIRISNDDAGKILTVGDLHAVVWRYLTNEKVDREEMERVINHIIADVAGLDFKEITADKKIADDLGID